MTLSAARFLWMLPMQPLKLRQQLFELGIEEPDSPLPRLWAGEAEAAPRRIFALRMLGLALLAAPLAAMTTMLILQGTGYLRPGDKALQAAAIGIAASWIVILLLAWRSGLIFGSTVGTALAVTLTAEAGVILGMLDGLPLRVGAGVLTGLLGGAAAGLALDIGAGLFAGQPRSLPGVALSSVVGGLVHGGTFSLLVGAAGLPESSAAGLNAGLAFGLALAATSLRLPIYPFEAFLQAVLYRVQLSTGRSTLPLSPLLFHDLGRLPYPWLWQHLLLSVDVDREGLARLLEASETTAGQHSVRARLLPYLQARELERLALQRDVGSLLKLRGDWLPSVAAADPWLLTFREAARYLEAAASTVTPYHRLNHLREAARELSSLEVQLLSESSFLAQALSRPVRAWQELVATLLAEADSGSARQIPNPFQAGDPLSREQGRELFRGRHDLVRQIETLLANREQSCSLALLGPRRCGKTSLLQMLPVLLPDVVCIFFDLQDNPLDSPSSLFRSLAARAQEQAHRDRRLELPLLPAGPPFEAGRRWLEELDRLGTEYPILICLDEFERLESLFPGDRRELLQLMGLIRATIQYRRRVRLLVSGASPFDELGPLWNDHFINLRELRIRYLDRQRAVELLTRPVQDFPPEIIPLEVAEEVFERTGGQPFLLQLYGSLLVEHLNEAGRGRAGLQDLKDVEMAVLRSGTYYFRHTYLEAPPPAREALWDLANDRVPALDHRTRRWLGHRGLLGEDDRLLVPVFGAWIREEHPDPGGHG